MNANCSIAIYELISLMSVYLDFVIRYFERVVNKSIQQIKLLLLLPPRTIVVIAALFINDSIKEAVMLKKKSSVFFLKV